MKIKFNKQFKNTKEKKNKQLKKENIEKKDAVLNSKNYTKVAKNNNKEVKYYSSASNEILKYKRVNKVSKPNAKKRVRVGNTQNSEILNKNKTENKIVNINMKKQFNNLFKNQNKLSKAYYFLLAAMVVLGAGSVYLVNKTYNLSKEEDYAVYEDVDNNEGVSVYSSINNQNLENTNKTEEKDKVVETNAPASQNTNTKNTTTNTTNPPKKNTTPKVEPLSFSKPVQGEVLKVYSIDKVIYSKTLELWKTHDGVDIQATIGQSVKSIEKGTIQKVYEDSFYGMTIVIDHGQGYVSSYSNLDTSITVKEKQTVKKGQVIGKISNTAIGEIKDDSHLHFMLFKDNQNIDPASILK